MDARDFAVLTLDKKDLPALPRQAFKRRSPVAPDDPRDRALGEQIVAGVVKNLGLLDFLLARHAKRPVRRIDGRARLILLVGLYQLRFLDRVPDHAIVTEAVRQTRRLDSVSLPKASGFVNAVLREAIRQPDVPLPPRSEPAAYAEVALSFPREVFERLEALLGAEDALRFCEHANQTPPTLLRLVRGRRIEDLEPGEGVTVRPHEREGLVIVEGARQSQLAEWSDAGLGQVQDATSAAAVGPLEVSEGMTVLDRCCGVGTKTQQLAELVGPEGRVLAMDAMGSRISTLKQLVSQRPDLSHIEARRMSWLAEAPDDWPRQHERVLIDAPCSNSGVLARRPEARYHQAPHRLAELMALQKRILADTWPAVAPGGRLAYVTCSIWPEENERIVADFLAGAPEARLVYEQTTWPSFRAREAELYHDGGYVAVLEKPAGGA